MQKELEELLKQQEYEFTRILSDKDREIRELKRRLNENEEEMKVLIMEIDKQKKLAKENIEKLHQLFK